MKLIFQKAQSQKDIQNVYEYNIDAFSESPDFNWNLKEIQKESDGGGGFLMFAGAAIILGDFVYDRIVGLRLIEQKRDRVRYKYGRNLNFSFKTNLNPLKQNFGFGLSFYFG